jgi:phosphate transport system permease protein
MATLQQKAKYYETSSFVIITILSYAIIGFLLFVLGYIFFQGYKVLSWDFIVSFPKNEMREGGIFPAIIGTLYLMIGSSLVSVPIGIMTAIYLTEYVENVTVLNFIRLGINNLAGVPSVVFGLFGMSVFVIFLDFGSSIIAGSLTLGILNLPLVIRSTEEALLTVPMSYREASLSLGATRWQTIYKIVVPTALPGILTGIMLSLGRAAGETAPIMFTCATFYTPFVPDSLFSEVMALPYHIYVLATAGTHIEATRPIQYGTAIVLIVLVLGLNLAGMIMRYSYRKKLKG